MLLLAAIPDRPRRSPPLVVLAAGTAVSMALLSSAFGYAITRGPVLSADARARARDGRASTLAFGGWYTLGAIGAVPYLL